MIQGNDKTIFSTRERIKRIKRWSGVFHLLTLSIFVLGLLWLYPQAALNSNLQFTFSNEALMLDRQRVLEAMDKLVRYEEYYHEMHGRYTRDLTRLGLPETLACGSWDDVHRHYELSVLDMQSDRLLLLAVGTEGSDRLTVDENYRVSANFILPPPAKKYLYEEADRMIRLGRIGNKSGASVYSDYWQLAKTDDANGELWYAIGNKEPVLGEKYEERGSQERSIASIFAGVSEQMKNHLGAEGEMSSEEQTLTHNNVIDFLLAARQAEHIYKRERGRYAHRWEELDAVTGFHFVDKEQHATNIRVKPIELTEADFKIVVEGTKGNLLGEQFVIDDSGSVRELRYTDALIHQLQESTRILESAFKFQINEEPNDEPKPVLDRGKAEPVKSE